MRVLEYFSLWIQTYHILKFSNFSCIVIYLELQLADCSLKIWEVAKYKYILSNVNAYNMVINFSLIPSLFTTTIFTKKQILFSTFVYILFTFAYSWSRPEPPSIGLGTIVTKLSIYFQSVLCCYKSIVIWFVFDHRCCYEMWMLVCVGRPPPTGFYSFYQNHLRNQFVFHFFGSIAFDHRIIFFSKKMIEVKVLNSLFHV